MRRRRRVQGGAELVLVEQEMGGLMPCGQVDPRETFPIILRLSSRLFVRLSFSIVPHGLPSGQQHRRGLTVSGMTLALAVKPRRMYEGYICRSCRFAAIVAAAGQINTRLADCRTNHSVDVQ